MSAETTNQELANEIRVMAERLKVSFDAKKEIVKYANAVEAGEVKRLPA